MDFLSRQRESSQAVNLPELRAAAARLLSKIRDTLISVGCRSVRAIPIGCTTVRCRRNAACIWVAWILTQA